MEKPRNTSMVFQKLGYLSLKPNMSLDLIIENEIKKFTKSKLNESNTYGFPEGKVDSGKVLIGGEGGNWGGSMDKALEILDIARKCKGSDKVVSSQKRTRVKTASGNVSDHYVGNTSAYAVDIPAKNESGDKLLACIMKKWNGGSNSDYEGGKWLNVTKDGYRYQFGWRVSGHYDHIHVGVKNKSGSKDTPSRDLSKIVPVLGFILPNQLKDEYEKLKSNFGEDVKKENIEFELNIEKGYYPDNKGVDNVTAEKLTEFLNDLYRNFPDAPKVKSRDCENIIGCVSGYRSYDDQMNLFGKLMKSNGGMLNGQKYTSLPGFSQHHSGKSFDILSNEISWWNKNPEIKNWVIENAPKYGFTLPYKNQGQRSEEPWHLTSKDLTPSKLTKESGSDFDLESLFSSLSPSSTNNQPQGIGDFFAQMTKAFAELGKYRNK